MSNRRPRYDVDELARDPWNRREDDPPYCPDIRASREVEPIVRNIAGMLTNSIERGFDENAIRRMAFNIVSENSYKNDEFIGLVEVAVLGVEAALIENPRGRTIDVARTVTDELVNMYVGSIAAEMPELERGRGVGRNVYDAAVRFGKELAPTIRDCKDILDRATNPRGRDYDRGRGNDRGRGHSRDDRNGSVYTRTAFDIGGGRSDNRGSDGSRKSPFGGESRTDDGDRNRQNAYGKDRSNQSTRGNNVETKKPEVNQSDVFTITDWRRTDAQPYLRAYPPYTYFQTFTAARNGDVQQNILRIGDDMDMKAHGAPYPSYMSNAAWRGNQAAVDTAITKLQSSLLAGKKKEDPFKDCDAWIERTAIVTTDGSMRGSVMGAKLMRAEKLATQPGLQVYGTPVLIRFQMLQNELPEDTREVDADRLHRLAQKNTFVEVRDLLLTLSEGFKRLHLNRINKMLTEQVNIILHHNLSLPPGFRMNNFVDDIDKVEDFMLDDYGPAPVDAWQKYQGSVISELFYQNVEVAEEGNVLPHSFFDHHYNLLLLTLTSGELGIEISEGVSMRLDESLSPTLHDLVKTQIKDLGKDDGLCTYIITNDGLVLAATRGWLADDCFLVRVLENVYM